MSCECTNVTDAPYNASGNGVTDDTSAIQQAIDDVAGAGGGTVFFPSGTYLITQLSLKTNVQLLGSSWGSELRQKANTHTQRDTGTATAGSSTTLTDSTKSWTTNQFLDNMVKVLSGPGVGQTRRIVSNTTTKLTIDTPWATNPTSASTYQIVAPIHMVVLAGVSVEKTFVRTLKFFGDRSSQVAFNDAFYYDNFGGSFDTGDSNHRIQDVLITFGVRSSPRPRGSRNAL